MKIKSALIKLFVLVSIISLAGCTPMRPEDGYFLSKAYNIFFSIGYIILLGVFIKSVRGAALGIGIILLISAYIAWVLTTAMYPPMNLVITLP
ncbi:hypothetical protein ABTA36_19395, partial [Acinetobacter baumannii]